MNPESPKDKSPETSALTTEAVAEFIVLVGKATVTNANHMAEFSKLFADHARQFLMMNLLTFTFLRQIFYLCLFNTLLLIWIVVHPLVEKPSPMDPNHDTTRVLQHVDEYRPQTERNGAP